MTVITPDTFDALNRYVGVRLQQGVPLVDADWNELEDVRRFELRAYLKWFVGDGVPAGNDGFRIVGTGANDDFTISWGLPAATAPDGLRAVGRCLVDGLDVMIAADIAYTAQALHNDNGAAAVAEAALVGGVDVVPDIPNISGPVLVYLDIWERLVTPTEDPQLILTGLGVESCARRKREWAVRTRQGTSLPQPGDSDFETQPGPHSYYALARIERRAGDPVVRSVDVSDLRERRLALLPDTLLEDTLGVGPADYRRGRDRPVVSLREAINALMRGDLPSTPDASISPAPGVDIARRAFALDGVGGLVAVWRSDRIGPPQILATRLALDDVAAGFASPPVVVTSTGSNDEPSLAVLPGGELVVAYRAGGAGSDVRFKRGTLGALAAANEQDITPAPTPTETERAPTVTAVGNVLVFFYYRTLPGPAELRVRRFRWTDGTWLDGTPLPLLTGTALSPERDLHAAVAPDGTLWVAVGAVGFVRTFQYSPTTGAVTNQATLSVAGGVAADRHPFVLVASDGTPYVFWHADPSAMPGVHAARFTAGAWTTPVQLAGADAGDFPAAAEVADGGIWVIWQAGAAPPHDLRVQRIDPALTIRGGARTLSLSPANDESPQVLVEHGSSLWVFWASDRNAVAGSPDVDLFYKRLVTSV